MFSDHPRHAPISFMGAACRLPVLLASNGESQRRAWSYCGRSCSPNGENEPGLTFNVAAGFFDDGRWRREVEDAGQSERGGLFC